ncbi:MAG: archease [Acidobacteria bacterium]|nr:archease [Acidobacteriota bacterium]
MSYEILPHTADAGLAARGRDLAEVFSEAARGLAAIVFGGPPPPPDGGRTISVEAQDGPALLVAFLEECLWLNETSGAFVVGARVDVDLGEESGALAHAARAAGEALTVAGFAPAGPYVKAVTYHRLRLEPTGEGWRAEVYLDV